MNRRQLVCEALGTFLLVLVGVGAIMVDASNGGKIGHLGICLAFGFVVSVLVYALGRISGAHMNPAVTIGLWSVGRFSGRDVLPYIAAQCAGAISASVVLSRMLGSVGNMGATLPAIPTASAFLVEFFLSFVLMTVVMAVVTDDAEPSPLVPVVIGLTVAACALVGGPLTGASMNPARSLGPALLGGHWDRHGLLYWAAPILGMAAAARLYEWLVTPVPALNRADDVLLNRSLVSSEGER